MSSCGGPFNNPYNSLFWSRAQNNCPNFNRINTYNNLNERRKAEILKYKNNSANLSKKQQYSRVNQGYTEKKNTYAVQNNSVNNGTNPNLLNLPLTGGKVLECKQGNVNCGLTTACDVPGPIQKLCLNPKVMLYNYKVRRTYKAGGTKWPYYFNKDYPFNQKYGF
jgi:hypothetical protein